VEEPPVGRRRRLTFRRLSGLDRSGPPPPQTLRGQPWRLWTVPNAIGLLRFALLPVFLIIEFSSDTGVEASAAVIYAVAAWTDYADGIAARLTGQYSRFGALMDPIVDRLLVICGVVVCWYHELLPRWALAVLVGRELFMLLAGQYVIRQGRELKINMAGDVRDLPRHLRRRHVRGRPALRGPGPHAVGHRALRARCKTLNLSLSVGNPLVCSRAWTRSPIWARSPTRS